LNFSVPPKGKFIPKMFARKDRLLKGAFSFVFQNKGDNSLVQRATVPKKSGVGFLGGGNLMSTVLK